MAEFASLSVTFNAVSTIHEPYTTSVWALSLADVGGEFGAVGYVSKRAMVSCVAGQAGSSGMASRGSVKETVCRSADIRRYTDAQCSMEAVWRVNTAVYAPVGNGTCTWI